MLVVVVPEFLESLVEVLEVCEGSDPEELFLEGTPEAFDAAIGRCNMTIGP